MSAIDTGHRHPSTQQIARWFDYDHLSGSPRLVSAACAEIAGQVIEELDDSPELVAGLRKLLEAKDCFVRAAITGGTLGASHDIR